MNASLTELQAQLRDIKDHLQTLKDSQAFLDKTRRFKLCTLVTSSGEYLKNILARRNQEKEYEFKANIVSLYGAFEHFVENLIREYLLELSNLCSSFSDMGTVIQNKYVEKWKVLHTSFKRGHTKYAVTEQQLIMNLNNTMINDANSVMAECFIPIGGNYRHDVVCDCLTDLGLTNNIKSNLAKYEPLNGYLSKENSETVDTYNVICLKINNLVDRRNEIAHGGLTTIMGDEEFEELIGFIDVYATTLNNSLNDELLRVEWEHKQGIEDKQPSDFFTGLSVAAFRTNHVSISIGGQYLVHWNEKHYPRYDKATIKELYVENDDGSSQAVDSVVATDSLRVFSIKTDDSVTRNCHFKFL